MQLLVLGRRQAVRGLSSLCVFSTSETCVAFSQATLQSPAHSELDLAPGPDCAWENKLPGE